MKRLALLLCGAAILGGCSWFNETMRSQSPEEPEPEEARARLVGDLAVAANLEPVRVEAVGLVTGLHGTGSDPAPTPERDALLEEMRTRGVANPTSVLASGDVAMVMVQAILPAGVQKGDRFDVVIRVPSRGCDTTSLRGGYLLETRLTEMAVLGNQVHRGNLLALAQGPVMIDPTADPKKDRVLMCRGRILGGGVATKSRPVGLVLTSGHHNVADDSQQPDEAEIKSRLHNAVFNSQVATAVNRRFNTFQNGIKTGVAKAKSDQYIELQVHPRYKDDITRYVKVVRAVPLNESAPEQMQRLAVLENKLLNPAAAAEAAIQLEAIGKEAVDTLLKGLPSTYTEVRFYAAEALAFLDRREAAAPLGQIARDEPAFRVFALAALSTMQEYAAYEQLRNLLAAPSAETRYGAFRAMWAMNDKDTFVRGEFPGGQFHYHVLDVAGPPMIHVRASRLPEIVVFGPGQRLLTPMALNAGNAIMVTSSGGDEVAVSKYSVKDGDQKRIVSTKVDDVLRAIVDLGGTYPDVVQALQEAKTVGALPSRFEIDALPQAKRVYDRVDDAGPADAGPAKDTKDATTNKKDGDKDKDEQAAKPAAPRPLPDMFSNGEYQGSHNAGSIDGKPVKPPQDEDDSDEKDNTNKGFFAKIFGWWK
jgi:flagellar basal body P-ring protein FlgI